MISDGHGERYLSLTLSSVERPAPSNAWSHWIPRRVIVDAVEILAQKLLLAWTLHSLDRSISHDGSYACECKCTKHDTRFGEFAMMHFLVNL